MRIAPTGPTRPDDTPRYSYVTASKLVDGSILRVEPSTDRSAEDATPCCVVTAAQMRPRAASQRLRFGDWLVRRGLIDRSDLLAALICADRQRCRVGDALVALALLDREQIEQEAAAFGTFITWR